MGEGDRDEGLDDGGPLAGMSIEDIVAAIDETDDPVVLDGIYAALEDELLWPPWPYRRSKWIPHSPTAKQALFLECTEREAFYGGAAAGGKSDGLLMAALQYVDVPGYVAVIMRRNFKQLSMPGGLIPRSHQWLDGTGARWHEGRHEWTFPSGATLTFGFVGETRDDREKWSGLEAQFIGIDEVTLWPEEDYRFLFSRLRRLEGMPVPTRLRSTSNPIGRGREWVKKRFVDPATRLARAVFIPATLDDNPHVNRDEYIANLQELHPTMWRRLLHGDWDVADPGEMFQPRLWLNDEHFLEEAPSRVTMRVRYWDLAAAEVTSTNPDPDYTAGARWSRTPDGIYVLEHVLRVRRTPGQVEKLVRDTMIGDTRRTTCWVEQVPGAGKALVDHYRRNVNPDPERFTLKGDPVHGSKGVRARPLAALMEKGDRFRIVRGPWNEALFDEMEAFSEDPQLSGAHDDQVDACSGGLAKVRLRLVPTGSSAAGQKIA